MSAHIRLAAPNFIRMPLTSTQVSNVEVWYDTENAPHDCDVIQRLSTEWRAVSNQDKLAHMHNLQKQLNIHTLDIDVVVFQER